MNFNEFWYLSNLWNLPQYSNWIKIWPECPLLYMKTALCLWLYLTELFLELETFQKICLENRITHFIFNNFSFQNRAVYQIMCKILSTTVNPSSLSVRSTLYAVLCSWLSHTCLLYQTLCSLCSTALTPQFIWWPYVVLPQVDNVS